MLTGSMAMNYYAQPRMTRDIDVVVALVTEQAELLIRMFEPDYYVPREIVRDSITHERNFNLIHQDSVIKVDCIIRKSSEYRRAEFERRKRVSIEDFAIWIVSKEDLILSKLDWARDSHSEMQMRDVANLVESGCDRDYVGRWAEALGVSELWEQCQP